MERKLKEFLVNIFRVKVRFFISISWIFIMIQKVNVIQENRPFKSFYNIIKQRQYNMDTRRFWQVFFLPWSNTSTPWVQDVSDNFILPWSNTSTTWVQEVSDKFILPWGNTSTARMQEVSDKFILPWNNTNTAWVQEVSDSKSGNVMSRNQEVEC